MAFSLKSLKCSQCGSNEFQPKGIKGYIIRSVFQQIGMRFFFQTNVNGPFVFKCLKCGTKIINFPKEAGADEILETPCVIKLTREGSLIGAMVDFLVFHNGKNVGKIGNKETIEIKTNVKSNLLFITDDSGAAFRNFFSFDAVAGETKEFNWGR
jgi:ribosomal protein S4E